MGVEDRNLIGWKERTFEASAEGSLAVPKSSVAFSRSTSFTLW